MAQVSITFNKRTYRFDCADGEAERLEKIAGYLKDKLDTLIHEHGAVGDERLMLMAALVPTALKLRDGPRTIISHEAWQELQSLASSVEKPKDTLIVARHGLEWWTAWTLHTHIAQAQALTADDWTQYKHVWFIEQKKGMNMPMGGPPGMGRGPDERRPRERGGDLPPGMMPPLGMMNAGPPGRGRGGMMGGMMGPSIPEDAEVLHEGEFFKLAWVREAPEFVRAKEANPLDILGGFP